MINLKDILLQRVTPMYEWLLEYHNDLKQSHQKGDK